MAPLRASLIVSVYNTQSLPGLLTSLEVQDFRDPWELLLCDDGSNVDMLGPMKRFAARNTHVPTRYVWQTDAAFRLSRSRNNAIRLADGEILIFVDGDVLLPLGFLSAHSARHLVASAPLLLCGSRRLVFLDEHPELPCIDDPSGEVQESYWRASVMSTYSDQARMTKGTKPWQAISGSNFSVPRRPEVMFDEAFIGWGLEDCELSYRLTKAGFDISCTDQAEVCHLESGPRDTFSPFRPRTQREIEAYVQNLIHFATVHPDADLISHWRALIMFDYEPAFARWSRRTYPRMTMAGLPAIKQMAFSWFNSRTSAKEKEEL